MTFIRQNIPLVIGALAFIGIGMYMWLIPWTQATIGPLYGPNALTDPFLATTIFLEKYGVTIERRGTTADLEQAMQRADVLIMTNQKGDFTEEQLVALIDWVRTGRTLVYQPTTLYIREGNFQDALLADRELRLVINPDKTRTNTPALDIHHIDVDCGKVSMSTAVTLDGMGEYQINPPRRLVLQTTTRKNEPMQPIYFDQQVGLGKIVILTGLSHWQNNTLHCYDNARFLRDLVVDSDASKTHLVWLERVETEPLLEQLVSWFPHAVVTFGALLLLWLWNRIPRDHFVPTPPLANINSLEDYLTKKAAFRWRYAKSLAQLQALRDEVGGNRWRQFNQADFDRISDATGMATSDIQAAFASDTKHDQEDLINAVTTLNRLRGAI